MTDNPYITAYQECLERLLGDAVPVDLVERRLRPVVLVLLVVGVDVDLDVVAVVAAVIVLGNGNSMLIYRLILITIINYCLNYLLILIITLGGRDLRRV